jgi:hypothetical protein
MDAGAEPGLGAPATGEAAILKLIALRWWRQALPVPSGKAPTLTGPAATHDLGGGESLEVYKGDGDLYRAVLVRRKGEAEEVRLLL